MGKIILKKDSRGAFYQNHFLPVLGRVAMQMMMVDITGLELQVGDVVTLPLRRTTANPRIPRIYKD